VHAVNSKQLTQRRFNQVVKVALAVFCHTQKACRLTAGELHNVCSLQRSSQRPEPAAKALQVLGVTAGHLGSTNLQQLPAQLVRTALHHHIS
jgi:hypothetical protein